MAKTPGDKRPRRRTGPKGATLLTDETKARFLTNLRTGVPVITAAHAAGLSRETVNGWMVEGRKALTRRDAGEQLTPYQAACADLTTEAQQVFDEVHLLLAGRVVAASAKDWKAATWMLQRRHPETWGLPERLEITGAGGGPIEVEAVKARADAYLDAVDVEEPSGNGQRALG